MTYSIPILLFYAFYRNLLTFYLNIAFILILYKLRILYYIIFLINPLFLRYIKLYFIVTMH